MKKLFLKTLLTALVLLTGGVSSAWADEIIATLDHTGSSSRDGSNTTTMTVDSEKEHYNNTKAAAWGGWAYAQFSFEIPDGQAVKSATLKWATTIGGTAGKNRDNSIYYMNVGTTIAWESLTSGTTLNLTGNGTLITTVSIKAGSESNPQTTDVTDAVKAIIDGSQTYIIFEWTNNPAGADLYGKGSSQAPILVIETASASSQTQYTVKYTDGTNELKEAKSYDIIIGESFSASENDMQSFVVDGKKWIYESGNSSVVSVAAAESNIVTLVFREAATYNYLLTSSLGKIIVSGSDFESETLNVGYPHYIFDNNVLYVAETTNKEYRKSIALTEDNVSVTVDYTAMEDVNVVFCSEAEDIEGMTTITTGNLPIRGSNAMGAVSTEDVIITNLPAGKYKIHVGAFTSKTSSQTIYIGYGETQIGFSSASNLNESASEEIILTESTDIKYFGTTSSGDAQFDYIWIEKTGDLSEEEIAAAQLAAARQKLQEAIIASNAVNTDGLSEEEISQFTAVISTYEALLTDETATAETIQTKAAELAAQAASLEMQAQTARTTAKNQLDSLIDEAEGAYVEGKETATELSAAIEAAKGVLNDNESRYQNYIDAQTPLKSALDAYYTANCETVALTADMFYNWDGFGADATKGSQANVDFKVGGTIDNGGMVAGTSTVDYLVYADLTGALKMQFEGKAGMTLRVLLNRQESNSGPLDELLVTIGSDGKAELMLSDYKNKYIHLNAIKEKWTGGGELAAINIVRFIDPLAEPTEALKGVIAQAESMCPNVFTEDSYNAMGEALDAANAALTAEDATVESLTEAATTLQTKIGALVLAEGYSNLTADLYKQYESHEATEGTATNCALDLNESSTLPYGDGNVFWLNYADLSGYDKLYVTVTETNPRFCFNRIENGGNDNDDESLSKMIDIPNNARSTAAYETVAGKTYVIDLAKMTTDKGFAHLHCIKGPAYNVATTVTGMYLYKTPEAPAFDPATAIVNANFEGEYSVYSNPQDDRAIYQPEGWTVSYTNGESNDMTALNSNCLAWDSFSGKPQPTNGNNNTYWIRYRWGDSENLTLSQVVTLPAGSYRVSADAYFNGADGGTATISANGVSTNIAGGAWGNYNVDFTVEEETDVTIAFGLKQTKQVENIAAFDNFILQDLFVVAKEELQKEIEKAVALKTAGRTEGLDEYNTAIANAESVYNNGTTAEVVNAAIAPLLAAQTAFLVANKPVEDGTYYVYNPLTEKFLARGNAYGTAAVVADYGVAITVSSSDANYSLVGFDNNASYGFDEWMYADAGGNNVRTYILDKVENGVTMTNTNNSQLVYVSLADGGDKYRVAGNAIKGDNYTDDAQTVWQFITPETYNKMIADRIAAEKTTAFTAAGIAEDAEVVVVDQKELTFATGSAWTQTVVRTEKNQPATNANGTEMWQATGYYTQTVSELPSGLYKVSIQAFYRNGGADDCVTRYNTGNNTVLAYLDANGSKAQVKSWAEDKGEGNDPNSMGQAKAKFDAGKYVSETYAYVAEDGKLNLTVYNPAFIGNGWFIVGNVKYAKVEASTIDLAVTSIELSGNNPYEFNSGSSCYLNIEYKNNGNAPASNFTYNIYDGEELIFTRDYTYEPVEAGDTKSPRFMLSSIFLDYTNGDKPMPGTYNIRFEIVCDGDANTEDNVASLTEPVTLYVLGDANVNGEVTTADAVATVGFALEREVPTDVQKISADVNKSETITVADAVGIVNIALNVEPEDPAAARGTETAVDYLTQNGMEIGLVNTTTFSAFQMDVTLSGGAMLSGVKLADRAQNLTLTYSQLSADTWRIVALSLDGSVISGSNGSLLSLDIMGQGSASVSHVEFADRAANAYELGFVTPTGISTLYNNKVAGEVYTVSGTRTGSMKKGVNVVRQADGSVSKVLVK